MSEEATEKKIQEKGLTAPRLTPEDIDAKIKGTTFTKLPSGKCMICEITLQNGFTVRGEASCVSPENFDQEIGEDISFKSARDKIWQLEGYLLQEKNPIGQTYLDRLIAEKKDLNKKIGKLADFIRSPEYTKLPDKARDQLNRQSRAMVDYTGILTERWKEILTERWKDLR